jgi:hypothetical protein
MILSSLIVGRSSLDKSVVVGNANAKDIRRYDIIGGELPRLQQVRVVDGRTQTTSCSAYWGETLPL